ncbi:hypothetical protein ACDQ55_14535 [Chitinophaga sp. 30R24]|uniref:hypothetical protein n=1 Tax=Chitinophaga sp. 30R24 TaxID=3248838 RepID=UPI003B901993
MDILFTISANNVFNQNRLRLYFFVCFILSLSLVVSCSSSGGFKEKDIKHLDSLRILADKLLENDEYTFKAYIDKGNGNYLVSKDSLDNILERANSNIEYVLYKYELKNGMYVVNKSFISQTGDSEHNIYWYYDRFKNPLLIQDSFNCFDENENVIRSNIYYYIEFNKIIHRIVDKPKKISCGDRVELSALKVISYNSGEW